MLDTRTNINYSDRRLTYVKITVKMKINMQTSKVGRRGQTTIPKKIREELHLREGDRVAYVRRGEAITLQPLTKSLLDLRGSVPVTAPQDFETIRRHVIDERARKAAESDA